MDDVCDMMANEPPIHLDGGVFEHKVRLSQEDLDALNALIHWLDGFAAGANRPIPGHYELSVVYRGLRKTRQSERAET